MSKQLQCFLGDIPQPEEWNPGTLADCSEMVLSWATEKFGEDIPEPDITVHISDDGTFRCHKTVLRQCPIWCAELAQYPETTVIYMSDEMCDLPFISFLYTGEVQPEAKNGGGFVLLHIHLLAFPAKEYGKDIRAWALKALAEYDITLDHYDIEAVIDIIYNWLGGNDEDEVREAMVRPHAKQIVRRFYEKHDKLLEETCEELPEFAMDMVRYLAEDDGIPVGKALAGLIESLDLAENETPANEIVAAD